MELISQTHHYFRSLRKLDQRHQLRQNRRLSSGFTNEQVAIIGSFYTSTNKPLLSLTNAQVLLEEISPPFSITDQITLASNNAIKVTNAAGKTNKLTLTIKTSGLITGSFLNPANAKQTIQVNGVLLQNQTNAQGYFLGTNQSGTFILARLSESVGEMENGSPQSRNLNPEIDRVEVTDFYVTPAPSPNGQQKSGHHRGLNSSSVSNNLTAARSHRRKAWALRLWVSLFTPSTLSCPTIMQIMFRGRALYFTECSWQFRGRRKNGLSLGRIKCMQNYITLVLILICSLFSSAQISRAAA